MSETNTEGGRGDGGPLGRIPEQVAQQATGIGRAVGDAVGPKAEDIANRSKAAGAALIGFALSRVVKAGVATGPADTASAATGVNTFGSEG